MYCLHCGSPAHHKIPEGDTRPRLVCSSCGYIHYENPKVICGVLAIHEQKILLCRRAIEPRYGFWTLPAGFMEIGESMRQGAVREMNEEAEATSHQPRLYCLFDLPHIGQIHVMYLGTLKDGQFGVGTESLECQLFAIDEIPWDEISFRTVEMTLRAYIDDIANHGHDMAHYPIKEFVLADGKASE